ncbi:MAG: hypothetical protein HOI95_02780 [Chromatiales bacterium]|nr:hypothetical protein [Chromatiales bacterium]
MILDRVVVKGRREAVRIFEPMGPLTAANALQLSWLEEHESGLRSLRPRHWDEAREQFTALAAERPFDGLYPFYLERIEHLRGQDLPDHWDGTLEMTSK